jgi:hypothetical protein
MKNLPRFILFWSFYWWFSPVLAQDYFIGIRGGVNFNTIGELHHLGTASGGGINVTPVDDAFYTADKTMGNHYGIFFKANFGRFFIIPEFNFTSMKNTYPLAILPANWSASKMEVPILIGFHLYKPISIYAGPSFSSVTDMELEGVEYPILFDKNSTGFNAGILIEYKRFGLDLRYQYGITAVDKQRIDMFRATYGTNVAYLLDYNPSQISLSFSVNLLQFNIDKNRKSSYTYDWRNHKNL